MSALADLRLIARRLWRAPAYAGTVVLTLGLGIALSTAMFSVLRGVLLGSLAYPDSDRVVLVGADNREQGVRGQLLTPAEAERLAEGSPFAEFGFFQWGGLTVYDGERPREFEIIKLSPGFFPAFGVAPLHGRWFLPEEYAPGADAVVLSYAEWQRLFAGDPAAIGQSIDSSDGRLRVVGVMPADYREAPSAEVGAWRPADTFAGSRDQPWYWNARFVQAVARLPAALAAADLQPLLDGISADLRRNYRLPETSAWQLVLTPLTDVLFGEVRGVLWGGLAIALLVLLIGCANVAVLVDARQLSRAHEQALDQALGASRAQLYRRLLLEVALLGLAAAALGSGLAAAMVEALRLGAGDHLPRSEAIVLDSGVLALALALGLLAPLLAAGLGGLRLRGQAAEVLRGGGKGVLGGGRQRRLLPALGIALSATALVAAGALWLSAERLQRVPTGFRSAGVHALQLFKGGGREVWPGFAEAMLERLAALPGVQAVALSTSTPLSPVGSFSIDLQVRGRADPEPFQLGLRRVSPGYLELLEIPLREGRGIAASDRAGSEPVVVINRELARRAFPDGHALDQWLGLPLGRDERIWYRVVGVMEDVRNDGLRAPPAPEALVAFDQAPWVGMTFLLRAEPGLSAMANQMADVVWALDPREAITRQFTLQGDIDAQLRSLRFFTATLAGFAGAALLLAAFGVYAVAALRQQQRQREFGLRLALGAAPATLVWQILGDGLITVAVGSALGSLLALLLMPLLQTQLYGQAGLPLDALGLGWLLIGLAAMLAAGVPAWRAGRTDPLTALREG